MTNTMKMTRLRVARWIFERMERHRFRLPDEVIGGRANPYMLRWYVIPKNRFFNVYLHRFLRSDDDRSLHDHPWANISFLLKGFYFEHTIAAGGVHSRKLCTAGSLKFRRAGTAHRVELHNYGRGELQTCWSLFVTGPKIREWGFHCPNGWRHWKQYTVPGNPGEIGRGCE